MSERLRVGDRVRIKDRVSYTSTEENNYKGQWVEVRAGENEYYSGDLTYYVRAADGNEWWVYDASLDFASVTTDITLSPEKAEEVREALEALGWSREDLGPLAAPEKPKRYAKADVEFPDDADYFQALEALEETARKWHGKITF